MNIDAIILAGGKIDEELAQFTKVHNKAYITIGGKMMVEYMIEAIREVQKIDRIALVTNKDKLPSSLADKCDIVIDEGETITGSLRKGIEGLSPKPFRAIVFPCDLPLITSESIEDFVEKSMEPPVDLTYGYLSRSNSEAKYPTLRHTYAKLKEGTFCGTGLFCMNPDVVENCEAFFNKLSKNRKNLVAMASLLGFGMILKFAIGVLKIKEIEKRILEILECSGRGIETPYAEAGFNVDKKEDLDLARQILGS